jgi:hypothetical protein
MIDRRTAAARDYADVAKPRMLRMMSPKAASWTVLASSGSEDDWIHVLPANLSLTLDFHKNDLDVADHNCAARSCVQVPMDSQSIFRLLPQEPRAADACGAVRSIGQCP